MEKSTVTGLVSGIVVITATILFGDGWTTFVDIPSAILVLGGTIAALMVTYDFLELRSLPSGMKAFFTFTPPDLSKYVEDFSDLARTARREGLLALDRRISESDDEFMRYGLEMAVDGIEENEIDELLKSRMSSEKKDRMFLPRFFANAGSYAPAFGMVGTLIGLIQMLQNLTDPSQIGKGMAVALITTFYGSILANLFFLPFSEKMKAQATLIMRSRELVRVGIMAIVRGESPSMIEKRLSVFLNGNKNDAIENRPEPLARAA